MPADFILCFSGAFLNRASSSVFPPIRSRMSRTEAVPDMKVNVTWAVSSPPAFQLTGADGGTGFTLTMPLTVTTTPDGGEPAMATTDVMATCRANIVAGGKVIFAVADLAFSAADPFLQAVLNAKKASIGRLANDYVSALAIRLGIIDGVTFAGYALRIGQGQGTAAGGLQMPVTVPPVPPLATDFAVTINQSVVQYIVQTSFWATVQKDYSASGADVHLNSYEAGLSNGQLWLNLHLSGSYSSAGAVWDISISTVRATLNFAVQNGCDLVIAGSDVSTPLVQLHPSNWVAYLYEIAGGIVTAITDAITNLVIAERIRGSISDSLNRKLLTVPVLSGSFEGVTITLSPRDLAVAGQGDQLVLAGNADVTAS